MARDGIKFNREGFRELRLQPGVLKRVGEVAEQVAQAAGPGFVAKQSGGRNRARYVVVPTTPEAYKANQQDLAVLRALGKV